MTLSQRTDRSAPSGSSELDAPALDERPRALWAADATTDVDRFAFGNQPFPLIDSLRSVVNRYELGTGGPLPKTIGVTSAIPGEGATTVAQALASLLAHESSRRVCYFDCGWLTEPPSKKQRSKRNNPAPPPDGRSNIAAMIADPAELEHALSPLAGQPNLTVLRSGHVDPMIRHTIARSAGFATLRARLDDRFDQVIFDIPSVSTTSGALALMLYVDASILVVKHRSTSVAQVAHTMQALEPTPNVAVLLNRFDTSIPSRLLRMLGG